MSEHIEIAKVFTLDDYRALEEIIKIRMNANHVVIATVNKDGTMGTFIPGDIMDIDLVYLIQTLSDRRKERLL